MGFIVTYRYDDEQSFRFAGQCTSKQSLSRIVSTFAILSQVSDIHIEETDNDLPFKIICP